MTSDERALQAWFTELARCVNDTDYPAGRRLFADDVVSFGTFTTLMHGLEDYATQQWPHVWPHVQHFRFATDMHMVRLRCFRTICISTLLLHEIVPRSQLTCLEPVVPL